MILLSNRMRVRRLPCTMVTENDSLINIKGNHDFHPPNQAEISAKLELKESLKRNLNENPFGEIQQWPETYSAMCLKR
ncbi:unnamed protein product [Blepharisma stoltei]|uniref:Uncharacterized protein n=1 Tax=Blepharisma stoltei TaxID=1481888 RepID=A0AAU9ILF2_9CILI|nr:unnamed protein product [Blepharisma stoltei]